MLSQEQKARFDEAGNHPVAWAFVGENLLFAARRLEADFAAGLGPGAPTELSLVSGRLQCPVLMLRGAALECLLKAVLVDEGKVLASGGRYQSPGGASHDRAHLASLTSLSFNHDERWMLKYLGFWINQGRYPVPSRASDRDIKQADGSPLESNWNVDGCDAMVATPVARQNQGVKSRHSQGLARVESPPGTGIPFAIRDLALLHWKRACHINEVEKQRVILLDTASLVGALVVVLAVLMQKDTASALLVMAQKIGRSCPGA